MGVDTAKLSDDDIQKIADERARALPRGRADDGGTGRDKIILDGVKAERWRILVGDDAHKLDERVRETPEQAYKPEFYQSFAEKSAGGSVESAAAL